MSKKVVTIIRQTFTKGQADLTFVHNPIKLSSHLFWLKIKFMLNFILILIEMYYKQTKGLFKWIREQTEA